jgi:hypothetical protein
MLEVRPQAPGVSAFGCLCGASAHAAPSSTLPAKSTTHSALVDVIELEQTRRGHKDGVWVSTLARHLEAGGGTPKQACSTRCRASEHHICCSLAGQANGREGALREVSGTSKNTVPSPSQSQLSSTSQGTCLLRCLLLSHVVPHFLHFWLAVVLAELLDDSSGTGHVVGGRWLRSCSTPLLLAWVVVHVRTTV